MIGSYQAQHVRAGDIIQNGQCSGPVAEPVVRVTSCRVAVVFICRCCTARHTLQRLPGSVVHVIHRVPNAAAA